MNERFSPDYRLELDGRPVPAGLRAAISSLSLTSALDGADRVEVSLANQHLRWTDEPLLRVGTPVRLSLGYNPDGFEQMFVGEVVSAEATFPADGAPTLTVAAQDRMTHLADRTQTRWYAVPIPTIGTTALPDAAIAPLLALENGFLPILDPLGATLSVLVYGVTLAVSIGDCDEMQKMVRRQQGQSDLDFLKVLARENGWDMLVDHSGATGGYKLRFLSPEGELEPVRTYRYGSSLVDWTPRVTSVGVLASITAYLRVSAIKTVFAITVGYDWDNASLDISVTPAILGSLPPAPRAGSASTRLGGGENSLVLGENLTLFTAPRRILGTLVPSLNNRLTGSGTVVGEPALQAGKVVQLEGLGEQYGGRYRITTATHTVGPGGYTTTFRARKEIWFGSIPAARQGAVSLSIPFLEVSGAVSY